jgi:hypothetical protein
MSRPSSPAARRGAVRFFLLFARLGRDGHGSGVRARPRHHAVVVGDDHVARLTSMPAHYTAR